MYEGLSIHENSLLVTLDVNALYTSIPHEDIRLVISTVLDSRDHKDPPSNFFNGADGFNP